MTFTIDTFTSDELTITIPVSANTLDATGAVPGSKDLFLIDSTAFNTSWVLGTTHTASGSGQLGVSTIDTGQFAMFDDNSSGGDIVRATFSQLFSEGDTVVSEINASWTGSNIFNPSGVNSLLLTWGTTDIGSVYPWGDPQGATAVPEPGSYAIVAGIASILLVVRRRRLAS